MEPLNFRPLIAFPCQLTICTLYAVFDSQYLTAVDAQSSVAFASIAKGLTWIGKLIPKAVWYSAEFRALGHTALADMLTRVTGFSAAVFICSALCYGAIAWTLRGASSIDLTRPNYLPPGDGTLIW
jgi:hypothetical protein